MARQKLPKIVFVASKTFVKPREVCLVAETDVTQLAELGESIEVGRYQLIEIATLNGMPILGNRRSVKP